MSRNLSWMIFTLTILLLVACSPLVWDTGGVRAPSGHSFSSNGERIYFSGTSVNGPIGYSGGSFGGMMGGRSMMGGRLACADCHAPDGRGGEFWVHMAVIDAPDIRWSTLTEADRREHGHEKGDYEGEQVDAIEHLPYSEKAFKQAVTQGIGPGGERLDQAMPRWNMSDRDLEDLIAYLKILS